MPPVPRLPSEEMLSVPPATVVLPDGDGISVLRRIKELAPDTIVILMTAFSTVENAVEAMKLGAWHYFDKPFNLDDVSMTVEKALETLRLRREVRALRTSAGRDYGLDSIVGASPAMMAIKAMLARVAKSPASTVLLTGETGTGKDLAAKVIHYNSDRAAKPFVNITCSALPEQLLESELFGHERGAFTGADTSRQGGMATRSNATDTLPVPLVSTGPPSAPIEAQAKRTNSAFRWVSLSVDSGAVMKRPTDQPNRPPVSTSIHTASVRNRAMS